MTMNKINSKLRKKNIKNYYMILFCTILSVMLVTSFALMYFSPTVQKILPIGGDSRKQAVLIFAIAIIGCAIFTTYASSLFFKYKSEEFGIFMALGETKSRLKLVLLRELGIIIPLASFVGLILSIPLSFVIWKLFQIFIVDTKEMTYQFSFIGIIFGIIFCIIVTLCVFTLGAKFLKRSNIIDIINEQRKTETIREVKSYYGILGWIMVIIGLFLGYALPVISIRVFKYQLPSICNLTFVISLVGLYLIMLHAVSYSKKGKNPKKYYNNIISTNMMKFTSRQTVKNMCVIAFLITGALFASFYIPTNLSSAFTEINNRPIDYTFYYMANENQIQKNEIYQLARKHNVEILDFFETSSISLITDGYTIEYGGNNKITTTYYELFDLSYFFSEKEFNRITGKNIEVGIGEYYKIISDEDNDGHWSKDDDLSIITHPTSNISENIKFEGTISFSPLNMRGSDSYVLSDEDFARLNKNLELTDYNNFVLFNVKNPNETYEFAKELKNEIILRSSEKSAVIYSYDYFRKLTESKGEEYWADKFHIDLSIDNNQLFNNWKYYPQFNILNSQDLVKNIAVFLMLFIYIAIICFVAVAIIAYTRSITIGLDNKSLFMDLKKLGANNQYIENTIKKQLAKIFMYPSIVGSISIYMLFLMILYGNSNSITFSEALALLINLGIISIFFLLMFGIYKLALNKIKKIIEL